MTGAASGRCFAARLEDAGGGREPRSWGPRTRRGRGFSLSASRRDAALADTSVSAQGAPSHTSDLRNTQREAATYGTEDAWGQGATEDAEVMVALAGSHRSCRKPGPRGLR